MKWAGDLGKVLDKPPVVARESKELLSLFLCGWHWPGCYLRSFIRISGHPLSGYDMAQVPYLVPEESTLGRFKAKP